MRKYIKWYYSQKVVKRFFVSVITGFLILLIFWNLVIWITGERWRTGVLVSMLIWLILSAIWSLSTLKKKIIKDETE